MLAQVRDSLLYLVDTCNAGRYRRTLYVHNWETICGTEV